jgi:hypothetical protein
MEEPLFRGTFHLSFFWKHWSSMHCHTESSGLTIGLPVWLFPTPVISNLPSASNAPSASDVSTPPTHQPHVDFSPSSPIKSPSLSPSSPSEISKASSQVDKKKKKQKEKKKKTRKGPSLQPHQMLDPSNQLLLIILGVLMRSTRLK